MSCVDVVNQCVVCGQNLLNERWTACSTKCAKVEAFARRLIACGYKVVDEQHVAMVVPRFEDFVQNVMDMPESFVHEVREIYNAERRRLRSVLDAEAVKLSDLEMNAFKALGGR